MPDAKPRYGRTSIGSLVVTALVVMAVLFLAVWVFGGVSGEEFSPQKFAIRRFHYWQIPYVRIQVWPVSFSKVAGKEDELAQHIRFQRWVGSVAAKSVRWDIVTMDEIGRARYRGDASILTNYLRQPGAAGSDSWLDWSKKKPQLAAQLWPLVARLAHEEIYVLIPELLDAARLAESEEAFASEIRSLLAKEFRQFAQAEKELGEVDRARQLVAIALEFETDWPSDAKAPAAEEEPDEA